MIEYRPVPYFDGYFAGSDGHIYSAWVESRLADGFTQLINTNIVQLQLEEKLSGEYYRTMLKVGGISVNVKVHMIIALSYKGMRPFEEAVVRHLDGNSYNNYPNNLEYGTHAQNVEDKFEHGTILRGEACSRGVLTEELVREIKQFPTHAGRVMPGVAKAFCEKYGIARQTVSAVSQGRSWKHVKARG